MKEVLKLPDWKQMWLTRERKVEIGGIPLSCFSASYQGSDFNPNMVSVGIDPGRNFGITFISELETRIYFGTMPSDTHEKYGLFASELISEFCNYHCMTMGDLITIEGAAYGSTFGQVGLAEIRFGFYLGAQREGYDPVIVPPASIRKRVFGSAKVHAGDIWPTLNHNAADSFAIALYPLIG